MDGVVIPALKVALLDGTSPHVLDPNYPGVVGSTVNLGQFIDEPKIFEHKAEVMAAIGENKKIYIKGFINIYLQQSLFTMI